MGQTNQNKWNNSPFVWQAYRPKRKSSRKRRWAVAPESKFEVCDETAVVWQVEDSSDTTATVNYEQAKTALKGVLDKLSTLKKIEDFDDEYTLNPTPRAYTEIKLLILETCDRMVARFPIPRIVPDGEGGLVADWLKNGRRVRLRFRSDGEHRDYIYYQSQDDYDVDPLTVENLINRLDWLINT